jgi:hypothetical protein
MLQLPVLTNGYKCLPTLQSLPLQHVPSIQGFNQCCSGQRPMYTSCHHQTPSLVSYPTNISQSTCCNQCPLPSCCSGCSYTWNQPIVNQSQWQQNIQQQYKNSNRVAKELNSELNNESDKKDETIDCIKVIKNQRQVEVEETKDNESSKEIEDCNCFSGSRTCCCVNTAPVVPCVQLIPQVVRQEVCSTHQHTHHHDFHHYHHDHVVEETEQVSKWDNIGVNGENEQKNGVKTNKQKRKLNFFDWF